MPIFNASAANENYFIVEDGSADFASFVASTPTTYAWLTTDGHRISMAGTGITINGSNLPTAGTITGLSIDLSDNDSLNPDIFITDLDLDITDFDFSSGSAGNQRFWELVLGGVTDFTLSNTNEIRVFGDTTNLDASDAVAGADDFFNVTQQNLNGITGDVGAVVGGFLIGGDDTFTGTLGRAYGDARSVSGDGLVVGGDDTFTATGSLITNSLKEIVGDVEFVSNTATLLGGDDVIDMSGLTSIGTTNVMYLIGDAYSLNSGAYLEGGNDILIASDFNTVMYGDVFSFDNTPGAFVGGDDTLYGGAGNDRLYGDSNDPIEGGGDDMLYGGAGDDLLRGDGGDDELYGGTGNDTLEAAVGENILYGGAGNDQLSATGGTNTLEGGVGNDTITASGGVNDIVVGRGADRFVLAGSGENTLLFDDEYTGASFTGLSGDDTLNFVTMDEGVVLDSSNGLRFASGATMTGLLNGANIVGTKHNDIFKFSGTISETDAGAGIDLLDLSNVHETFDVDLDAGTLETGPTYTVENFENVRGGDSGDTLSGTDEVNLIYGEGGADTLYGLEGKDRLFDGSGDDTVYGGDDSDYFRVGDGANSFYGGSGKDYLSYYDSDEGVVLNLGTDSASGGWADDDIIDDFESVGGTRYGDDSIIGTTGSNTLNTYGGDDRVSDLGGTDRVNLGAGDDYVRVGGGKDSYDGGTGVDYISYYQSSGGVTLDLKANTATGSWANNDTVKNFESASGSNTGGDLLKGTDGYNDLRGYGGNDNLQGKGGNDLLQGGKGDDKLYGASGADTLYGGDGEDFLDGGGGSGTDRLFGDDGDDVFHFDRGEGNDRVMDFENNDDTIEFDNFSYLSTVADAIDFAEEIGPHVFFDFGADGTLLVENTTINRLLNDIDIV